MDYLRCNFPNGNYFSAYEAGFCGLWAHFKLEELGIHKIVINPFDVPTTQKEQIHKSDPVDSKKNVRSLRAYELKGIYIPRVETLEDRSLIPVRSTLVKDLTRINQRTMRLCRSSKIAIGMGNIVCKIGIMDQSKN